MPQQPHGPSSIRIRIWTREYKTKYFGPVQHSDRMKIQKHTCLLSKPDSQEADLSTMALSIKLVALSFAIAICCFTSNQAAPLDTRELF